MPNPITSIAAAVTTIGMARCADRVSMSQPPGSLQP
jgi:hypothetical protein